MKNTVETDIAIVGGGIAGLWLLNRLRQLGYSAILLESATLGGGQTIKSQGIIHGGMKYALQGILTPASQAIAAMPEVWAACLEGRGVLDLSKVPILSKHQYLWSTGMLASKLTGFFASLALKGNVTMLAQENFPDIFQQDEFKGQVYSLDELVIDLPALVRELVKPHQDAIFKIDPLDEEHLIFNEDGQLVSMTVEAAPFPPVDIKAQKIIFTAGAGNALLIDPLKKKGIAMQCRPLHMVLVKTEFSYSLYAHCFGMGATPRMTITTHKALDGKSVWYLGGQIAEEGVERDSEAQIAFAKKELQELFPWLDFSDARFASFFIDRAEAAQPGGKRPDTFSIQEVGNAIVAWPTKLAFAPALAEEVIALLSKEHIQPSSKQIRALRAFPCPSLSRPVWDELL
jgi:glycerol-3-phosphate dehydrogenase